MYAYQSGAFAVGFEFLEIVLLQPVMDSIQIFITESIGGDGTVASGGGAQDDDGIVKTGRFWRLAEADSSSSLYFSGERKVLTQRKMASSSLFLHRLESWI